MKEKKLLKVITLPLLATSLLTACNNSDSKSEEINKDLELIRQNYINNMVNSVNTKAYEGKTIDEIKAELTATEINGQATYLFKNIDYSKDQDRATWPAGGHLSKTLVFTVLAHKNNDEALKDVALKCLYHWVYSNYRNTNWWQNEIGANQNLSNIGMFLFQNLNIKGQEAFKGKLWQSSIYHRPSLSTHEGSNLLNYCEMTIKSSICDNEPKELETALNSIVNTITVGGREGYQNDGSFFQHGRLLQTGSYGIEGTAKIGNVLSVLKGTEKAGALPTEKLSIISNYILNGLRSMTHKGMYNYIALGRAYSRVNALDVENGTYKVSTMKNFTNLSNMPQKEEIDAYIADVVNKDCKTSIQGVSAYTNSNVLVGNYDDVYMSFKGTDPQMTNTECVNHENLLGYNLSYGQNTAVMQSGREYYNISPLWDYTRLPGSTSRDFGNGTYADKDAVIDSYVKNVLDNGLYEAYLPTENPNEYADFEKCIYNLGKDTTNNVGFSMTQSVHDITSHNPTGGVEFRSTCFMNEDGMFILGSGINNKQEGLADSEKVLHTTLEQCILESTDAQPALSTDKLSVEKGKVVYKSLNSNQKLTLNIEERENSWKRNNPSLTGDPRNKGNIMTISLNDGTERVTDYTSYAYAVQPKSKVENNVTVLKNDKDAAAIKFKNGKVAIAFYTNNDVVLGDGTTYKCPETYTDSKGAFKVF